MKIVGVDCHVLLDPDYNVSATSSAQDDIVVEIHTDEGITGIGESDVNPWIARACIEAPGTHTMDRGLGRSLIGLDPLNPEEIWRQLYVATAMAGRRGAVVHALGAIDMALWDIRGKAAGVPIWQLLGEQRQEPVRPYASLEPEVTGFDDYVGAMVDWARRAVALGFPAVKVEATFSGPYANMGIQASDGQVYELLAAVREAVGPAVTLMVDVQYAFESVERALRNLQAWADLDLFFVEAPLWIDDLDAYRTLTAASPIPIAVGEWLATHYEFRELVEHGHIDVLQPDVGRVGGIDECVRVCQLADQHGLLVVPHAWKTGLTLAASAHLAAVTPHMPYVEFLHPQLCESRLRQELVDDEVAITRDGLSLPERPGLGVELNRAALEEFEDDAQRMMRT